MADIGRWGNIDAKSEKYLEFSNYAYCINSPIFYIDPNGMEIVNGETANRQRLQLQSDGYNKRFQDRYQGNTEMSRKDFGSRDEYREYKQDKKDAMNFSEKLAKSIDKETKINESIKDFATKEPENFKLANNLTFKDSGGKEHNIDVKVLAGNASEFGGAKTIAAYEKNSDSSYKSIASITTTLDFRMIKPVSDVLAHEMGHAYTQANQPVSSMADKETHDCQDSANRNTLQSKTAKDWQDSYPKPKKP